MERQIYTQRNRFTHRETDIHTYENLRCQNRCGKLSFKLRRSPPPPDRIVVLIRTDLSGKSFHWNRIEFSQGTGLEFSQGVRGNLGILGETWEFRTEVTKWLKEGSWNVDELGHVIVTRGKRGGNMAWLGHVRVSWGWVVHIGILCHILLVGFDSWHFRLPHQLILWPGWR